jgi:hypothetical protein
MGCAALAKKGNISPPNFGKSAKIRPTIREAIHKTGFDPLYGAWRRLDRSRTPRPFSERKTIPASERPISHVDIGAASDWEALILLHALNRRLSRARFVRKLRGRPAEKAAGNHYQRADEYPRNPREPDDKRSRKYGSLTFKRSGRWTCGSRSSSPAASSTDGTELPDRELRRPVVRIIQRPSRHHGPRRGRCARKEGDVTQIEADAA